MKTKEEILSARIGTCGFTKLELSKPIICTIEALDAMQEYSDQNTKPLIDEIAELIKEVEYQKSGYITLKEYLKTDDILGAITKLKSELKASKSEATTNELELSVRIRQYIEKTHESDITPESLVKVFLDNYKG